jgi:hypothetical protein
MLVEDMSRTKCFFQVQISHVLHLISICNLFTTYACETWTLKEVIKHRLLGFERKILREIFSPSRNYNGSWRSKTNDELDNLIKGRNIVNFIKAQRISWLGHISRMEAGRSVKKYMTGSHML